MKTLFLVRHAKSSWKHQNLDDIERPLKKRGLENAELMAKILKKGDNVPELIITSPAVRAHETAKIFTDKFSSDIKNIIKDEKLYMADYDDFVSVIKQVPENTNKVMLISHNPSITSFACSISNTNIDNIPTSGVVRIDFNINSWQNITSIKGEVIFFKYPKKYSIEDN